MACTPGLPHLPPIPLPPGITLGVVTPPINLDVNACCKIFSFAVPPIPVSITLPIPGVVAVIVTALNLAITGINTYVDSIGFDCPLE